MDNPRDLEKTMSSNSKSKNGDLQSVREGTASRLSNGTLAFLRKTLFGSAESRGIDPVPIEERVDKRGHSLFTLWFTANCTLLPISTGMSGTFVFRLSLKVASIIIVLSTLLFMFPVAWMGMMGPKTGLRQIVQTRYYFGLYLVLVIALLQLATLAGYTIITSIVGGQTLAALSGGSLSDKGGIVIISLCALPISFMGYRCLHYFESYSWIPSVIAIIVTVGVGGKHLSQQVETSTPTVRQVLTFVSLCASLSLSWAALVSDFSVYISPSVPRSVYLDLTKPSIMLTSRRYRIFLYVYAGYCIPSILLLVLGAAIGGAIPNVASWNDANNAYSVGGVMYSMVSSVGGFGKFVAVLLALSVVSLNSCSLYSLSISLQSLHPILLRVPRYAYSIVVAAIVAGVSVAAAANFYASLSNFLGVVGYWTSSYAGIAIVEHHWFRKGDYSSYSPQHWDVRAELPSGVAAVAALFLSFGLIVPSMDAVWYVGPFASKIGDIGIEVGFCLSSILYFIFRTLELRLIRK
ncbi:hypothetical protein CEP52_007733 [Fusarium oligoseptatum]|uniref:Purine-cytosine permease n=1 Tax=Fusarium oligoseptatum TaxID=2604345 RepID=A0A428TLE6_9HYPO|nr:hypothetical protein CEP52_007733 [Fusarium oligoseptatum]